jgi:tetratricopeptide (TPR) repeat protein
MKSVGLFARVLFAVGVLAVLPAHAVVAAAPGAGPTWIRDFAEGQRRARAEGKDLFVVLTGHGWCSACQLLDREVFQIPEFVRKVSPNFVWVELDFTFGDSEKEKVRERAFRELQKRFLAPGVPLVVLLDREGVPYAYAADGYDAGTGPQRVLARVNAARAARVLRDKEFVAASKASGLERARRLHAGLEAVAPFFGSLKDHGDDPLLAFYPKVIAEIRQLDAADGRLSAPYIARQNTRDRWVAENDATFGKMKEFERKKDYKGAIRFVDQALKEAGAADLRWRLELARQVYLEWDAQYAAALDNARRLLADPNRTPEQREPLLDREAYNLFNSGRIPEGVAQFDRRIRETQGHPAKQMHVLRMKASMLISHRQSPAVSRAERYRAWQEYRAAAVPMSDDWSTATAFLGRQYMLDGDYRDALPLLHEFLQVEPDNAWVLLDLAESNIGLGKKDEAREQILAAESTLPANPARQDEKDQAARVRARIDRLRDKMAKQTQIPSGR